MFKPLDKQLTQIIDKHDGFRSDYEENIRRGYENFTNAKGVISTGDFIDLRERHDYFNGLIKKVDESERTEVVRTFKKYKDLQPVQSVFGRGVSFQNMVADELERYVAFEKVPEHVADWNLVVDDFESALKSQNVNDVSRNGDSFKVSNSLKLKSKVAEGLFAGSGLLIGGGVAYMLGGNLGEFSSIAQTLSLTGVSGLFVGSCALGAGYDFRKDAVNDLNDLTKRAAGIDEIMKQHDVGVQDIYRHSNESNGSKGFISLADLNMPTYFN